MHCWFFRVETLPVSCRTCAKDIRTDNSIRCNDFLLAIDSRIKRKGHTVGTAAELCQDLWCQSQMAPGHSEPMCGIYPKQRHFFLSICEHQNYGFLFPAFTKEHR